MAKLKIGRLFGRNLYIGSDQDFNDMEEGSYMIVTEKNSVSSLVMKSHGEAVDIITSGGEQNTGSEIPATEQEQEDQGGK